MFRKWMSFLAGISFLLFAHAAHSQEVLDKIVAVIDDNIILLSDLNQFATEFAMRSGVDPRNDTEKFEKIRKTTLEKLVVQKVLLVQAKEDSIEVDERQVEKVLDDQVAAMVQQLGSEAKLEEYFGASLRKIRRNFRKEIEERLLVEGLQSKRFGKLPISRREVEAFYETVKDSLPPLSPAAKLRHILVSVKPSAEAKKKALDKIKEAQQKLNEGMDFAEVAKAYSDDPGSAENGGDLGFTQRGDFVKEFEEVAFSLDPGEVSDIVESSFGYHIIQLLERRGEKIHTRHILAQVPRTKQDEDATRQMLDSLRTEILAGNITFEEAAKLVSEDETTKDRGGDLGWFELSQLQVPEFRQVAENLMPGELSDPLRTQFGFHLVRVDDRREARKISLEKDYDQLMSMARAMKREKEMRKWVEEIKKNVYIKINL